MTREISLFPERDDVRLLEGGSRCAGKVELLDRGQRRIVSGSRHWGMTTATVVCRQLRCGAALNTTTISDSDERPVWSIDETICEGSESALRECLTPFRTRFWNSTVAREVVCSGIHRYWRI